MSDFTFSPEEPVNSYRKPDSALIASVILLWGLGIFTVLIVSFASANSGFAQQFFPDRYYFFKRQLISSIVGFLGLILFANFRISFIREKIVPFLLLLSIILCFLTKCPGIGIARNGASRWIRFPFSTFQPAELAKFALILFFANYFVRIRENQRTWNSWIPVLVLALFDFLILVWQSDMSTAILITIVAFVMFIECGIQMRHLMKMMILGLSVGMLYLVNVPYRLRRVLSFLSPENFAQTTSYQPIVAQKAISAGGLFGVGVGSDMTKIIIPEVQTDYIFAGWTEAMGFFGVVLFFLVSFFFYARAWKLSCKCTNMFAAFGSFGCMTMLLFQTLLNCAVAGGVAPSTGIPLPFFSYGGSSLIVTLSMCGFMINASRYYVNDNFSGMDLLNSEGEEI